MAEEPDDRVQIQAHMLEGFPLTSTPKRANQIKAHPLVKNFVSGSQEGNRKYEFKNGALKT